MADYDVKPISTLTDAANFEASDCLVLQRGTQTMKADAQRLANYVNKDLLDGLAAREKALDDEVDRQKQNLQKAVDDAEDDFDNTIATAKSSVDDAVTAVETALNTKKSQADSDIDDVVTQVRTKGDGTQTTLEGLVDEAKGYSDSASSSATAAANSAITAGTKADDAATSATNAASSATTASDKATEATTSATDAATSATTATNQATAAATSATNAETSATNANTAKEAAEHAQAEAEAAAQEAKDVTHVEIMTTTTNGIGKPDGETITVDEHGTLSVPLNTDMIASEFDETKSYAVGDFVIHEKALYKCTAAHTGAWDASHFQQTSVGDAISNVGSDVGLSIVDGCICQTFGTED